MTSVILDTTKGPQKTFSHTFLCHGVFLGLQLPDGEADIPAELGNPSKGVLPVLYWTEFGGEGQSHVKCGHNFGSCTDFWIHLGNKDFLLCLPDFAEYLVFVISLKQEKHVGSSLLR